MPGRRTANSFSSKEESNESRFQVSYLKQVEFLSFQGKYNEALKNLMELEKRGGSNLDKLRINNVKSLIFTQMGDVVGGLNLADQAIEESQQIGDLLILFDANVVKASALFELGELNTCLDVVKTADYVIDLGPEGGDDGGYIVVEGTPEEVVACEESYTGQYMKELLEPAKSASGGTKK